MMSALHLLWIVPICVLGGFMWAALVMAAGVEEHEEEYDDAPWLDD